MGKGHGLFSRAATAKIGALAAVVLLVLGVPTLAFAANTATFSSVSPKGGSATKVSKPSVSVVVYDKYGVKGSSNYSLYLDGVKKSAKISYYSGYGYKKFKLSYAVPTALTNGSHTVLVKVKDTAAKSSSYSWKFTVDTVAPVTLMNGQLAQFMAPGAPSVNGFVFLTATDAGSGVSQTYFSVDGATPAAGVLVVYNFTPGTHRVEYWSVDKAGNVEGHHIVTTIVANGHSLPTNSADSSCLATGCHGGVSDVLAIHQSVKPNGCPCHSSQTLTNDCVACHSGSTAPANHAAHVAIDSSATAGSATDCTNSGCHGSSLMGIHGTCATCHNPDVNGAIDAATVKAAIAAGIAGTPANCETCHGSYSAVHAAGNTAHTMSGSCFTAYCHGTDVTKMHTTDFRGTGATPPGCAACHSAGRTPTTNCGSCHPDLVTPHNVDANHALTTHGGLHVTGNLITNSSACVACHDSDLTNVAAGEHKGCSCHAYGIAGPAEGVSGGQVACQNCHKGSHAPHGFGVSNSASGHNTTTYGTVGAHTKFDGTEGVVVKSTTGATITATWALPQNDVFWSATATDAPAGSKTGLGWNSVVTCQDCHSNLSKADGPQGANIGDPGLDSRFSGSFEDAYLWDGTATQTVTAGGSPSSGIGHYTPAGSTEEQKQEIDNWGVGITGPATVSNGNDVICAKCHDLYNSGTGYIGWSNYAHEHHANRPVVSGVWQMSDGTTVTATTRPTSTDPSIVATIQVPALSREGAGACRDCHAAIPHAWQRPRLIVYSSDAAPYNIGPSVYEGESKTATSGVSIGSGQMNGLSALLAPSVVGTGTAQYNNWSSSQCNACGHHAGTNLSTGAWK